MPEGTPRHDGRANDALRPIRLDRGYLDTAAGAVLISCGDTRVLCTASVEERQPPFLVGSQKGWVTAEYAMLPASCTPRKRRGSGGREREIQRLIGRSLRAAVDMDKLGPRTITLDCDVLQADGGTRCASITGAYVALVDCLRSVDALDALAHAISAVSVGMVGGAPMLDLCYEEDAGAEVDLNVVMTGDGAFVEVQGTAESRPFDRAQLDALLDLAVAGNAELSEHQRRALTAEAAG